MDLETGRATSPYRPHRGLALAAIVFIGGVVPSELFGKVAALVPPDSAAGRLTVAWICLLSIFVFSLGSGIVFLTWLAGAYRNLPALGSTARAIGPALEATPSTAVWSFIIPVVCWFRGRRVMRHLWRESQPEPAVLADGTHLIPATPLVDWWYATWISSCLLGIVARTSTNAEILSRASSFVAAVLCCMMVWRIEARQAAQMRDLQLRQPAPPVVDNLR